MRQDGAITIPVRLVRRLVVGGLAVALVLAAATFLWQQREAVAPLFKGGLAAEIDSRGYQAIFLAGGQVYFGRLSKAGDDLFLLSDVYYLSEPREGYPRGQLVKRGSELHGPREPMILPARQVVLIENLREDSEVVQAITRHRAGEPLAPAAPPLTSQPAPATTPRPSGSR